jgi:hypothetical protein
MKYLTKPLEFKCTDKSTNTYTSTNGIKEYQMAPCGDVAEMFVARSTDEEFFEYCKSWDDAQYLCEKNQEELVRAVLKDHLLEILNNTPD